MRLLLDTHVVLWWFDDDPKLSASTAELIDSLENDVAVSIASLWEMVVKTRTGKLNINVAEVDARLRRHRFRRLAVELPHLFALRALPMHHRDPFDHLLMAQAVAEDMALMTDDAELARYPVRLQACR